MFFLNDKKWRECLDFSASKKNQVIFGFQTGEKSFFAASVQGQTIVVVSDFIAATAYKAQIESQGKTAEIISGGLDSPMFVYSQDTSQIKKLIRNVSMFNSKTVRLPYCAARSLSGKTAQKRALCNSSVNQRAESAA
jgi:hypothetical protein